MNVGIIGLGNIGHALAEGLAKTSESISLFVYDHNRTALTRAKNDFKSVKFLGSVEGIIENSKLILVCIRTAQVEKFVTDYANCFVPGKIVVFFQANLKNDFLTKSMKTSGAIAIRAIANINVASRNGFTFVLSTTNSETNKTVNDLFTLLGKVQIVGAESQLDSLSLLSGCTPALIAMFYDAIIQSGVAIGIPKNQTEELMNDIIYQTLKNIKSSKSDPLTLKKNVCTAGGVVETAMKRFDDRTNFRQEIVKWLLEISVSLR